MKRINYINDKSFFCDMKRWCLYLLILSLVIISVNASCPSDSGDFDPNKKPSNDNLLVKEKSTNCYYIKSTSEDKYYDVKLLDKDGTEMIISMMPQLDKFCINSNGVGKLILGYRMIDEEKGERHLCGLEGFGHYIDTKTEFVIEKRENSELRTRFEACEAKIYKLYVTKESPSEDEKNNKIGTYTCGSQTLAIKNGEIQGVICKNINDDCGWVIIKDDENYDSLFNSDNPYYVNKIFSRFSLYLNNKNFKIAEECIDAHTRTSCEIKQLYFTPQEDNSYETLSGNVEINGLDVSVNQMGWLKVKNNLIYGKKLKIESSLPILEYVNRDSSERIEKVFLEKAISPCIVLDGSCEDALKNKDDECFYAKSNDEKIPTYIKVENEGSIVSYVYCANDDSKKNVLIGEKGKEEIEVLPGQRCDGKKENKYFTKGTSGYCASYVTNVFNLMFGRGSSNARGVYGDAWEMSSNIVNNGGQRIFWIENYIDNDKLDDLRKQKAKGYSNAKLKEVLKPILGRKDIAYPSIKVGDIISFFNPTSGSHDDAIVGQKDNQINTHVGIVVCIDENGPKVAHVFGAYKDTGAGIVYVEYLSETINGKKDQSIYAITRPDTSQYHL